LFYQTVEIKAINSAIQKEQTRNN